MLNLAVQLRPAPWSCRSTCSSKDERWPTTWGPSDAKAYFCFEGTAELVMAEAGLAGFNDADGCEHFIVIPADPTGAVPVEAGAALT